MKQNQIPVYIDPDNFEGDVKYPCSTDYMVYKTMVSKYFLTEKTIEDYDILVPGGSNPKKLMQFIEEITEDLYGVMARLAPFNYQYNCYLVAQSRSARFPSRYACRKQFEKALIYQAQYRAMNIDVRDINGIDLDTNNNIYHKQLRKELRHISPKALDILHALGLLYNGNVPAKHLINYSEMM